jgi:predicted cation transporter
MELVKQKDMTLMQVFLQSWLAWGLLCAYVALSLGHDNTDPRLLGALALGAIVLAMNGMAKTELWFTSRSPDWWRKHPILKAIHHVHNEGEMAGVAVAVVILLCQLGRGGHPHYAVNEAFALAGIMSAANLAVRRMMPILKLTERLFGTWGAIVVGSLLASVTGPAAAIFLAGYFKPRTPESEKVRVTTGLATAMGSGAGLIPFASPPILIVWAVLQKQFGWGISDLLLFVGVGAIFHVALTAWSVRKLITPPKEAEAMEDRTPWFAYWPLALLFMVVAVNMSLESHKQVVATWVMNALVTVWALAALGGAKAHGEVENGEEKPQGQTRDWQPVILAFLLMGLEIVGGEAGPLIEWIASFIPQTLPVWLIAILLWWVTAFVSHFADNALASRVFITVAVTLAAALGAIYAALLAAAVLLGALFGGFVFVPANLPNFKLKKEFGVSEGEWAASAWRWYWTGIAHIIWLLIIYFFFC